MTKTSSAAIHFELLSAGFERVSATARVINPTARSAIPARFRLRESWKFTLDGFSAGSGMRSTSCLLTNPRHWGHLRLPTRPVLFNSKQPRRPRIAMSEPLCLSLLQRAAVVLPQPAQKLGAEVLFLDAGDGPALFRIGGHVRRVERRDQHHDQ